MSYHRNWAWSRLVLILVLVLAHVMEMDEAKGWRYERDEEKRENELRSDPRAKAGRRLSRRDGWRRQEGRSYVSLSVPGPGLPARCDLVAYRGATKGHGGTTRRRPSGAMSGSVGIAAVGPRKASVWSAGVARGEIGGPQSCSNDQPLRTRACLTVARVAICTDHAKYLGTYGT
ncbi:hypothetical protein EDB81DRAFT_188943 [Dactylonectria macrodidyma]|uniref:Secreted protein n=1 Tax=Dactylonectria macrodidyma TaxID=307937 RepID=A0A9P9FRK6_9HYPO|nr:hypothetical protein EDB81DRAFT_188943 [Dactylonectria macrodidyma]